MPSREYLEKLFEAENEANSLISEARAEAARRVNRATNEADQLFSETRAGRQVLLEAETMRQIAEIDEYYQSEIAAYRILLESTAVSYKAFEVWCEDALDGFF